MMGTEPEEATPEAEHVMGTEPEETTPEAEQELALFLYHRKLHTELVLRDDPEEIERLASFARKKPKGNTITPDRVQNALKSLGKSYTKLLSTLNSLTPDHRQAVLQAILELIKNLNVMSSAASKSKPVQRAYTARHNAEAGRESGKKRRARREETWERTALDLAKTARDNNPSLSQDGVATEIEFNWKREETRSHDTLKDFVSRMETDGKLPKRATAKR